MTVRNNHWVFSMYLEISLHCHRIAMAALFFLLGSGRFLRRPSDWSGGPVPAATELGWRAAAKGLVQASEEGQWGGPVRKGVARAGCHLAGTAGTGWWVLSGGQEAGW